MNLKKRDLTRFEMSIPSNKKNLLKLLLKLAFAGGALYFVLSKISFREILQVLSTANWYWLILALLLFVMSKVLSSFRLNQFFKVHQLQIAEMKNLQLYWLGMFYNLFLPGGIGGDAYKIFLLNKEFKTSSKSLFSAVLVDRLSGMSLLVFLAVVLLSFIESPYPFLKYSAVAAPLVLVGFYVFLIIFFKKYLPIFPSISLYSLFVQLLQLICVFFILKAFQIQENEISYLVLFLISSIVSVIPVSIGGIGIRELCFLYGSQILGLHEATAITVSFCFYLITMIGSFPGIIFIFKPIFTEEISEQYESERN